MQASAQPASWHGIRTVAAAFCLVAVAGHWHDARAATTCTPSATPGVEHCVSGLRAATLSKMYQAQQATNWCWAASVAMILGRYGLAVPQEQVVRTLLGRTDNTRASADAMQQLLSRSWSDLRGRSGDASAEPLPPWRRQQGVVAPEVLDDLGRGKPLLVGVQQHAMVLVQVTYERRTERAADGMPGVRLLRALVLDPASTTWLRSLQPHERQPDFIARVDVALRDAAQVLAAARDAVAAPQ